MSMINVSGLTFCYEGGYDNIFENVSFQMDTDWRLGLVGRNGRGKTTLLRLLMGWEEYRGTIDASVDFTYFPYPVEEEDALAYDIAMAACGDAQDWQLMRELNLLRLDLAALYRPFSTLSNGERTKLLLAAQFLREDGFPLIDEPTNHLDADAREAVASYLQGKRGFLLVSHDRAFLDRCVDHIVAINKCGIEIQRGNFSSWMENKEARDRLEQEQNSRLKGEVRRLRQAARQTADWSRQVEQTKKGARNGDSKPDRGYIGHKSAKMMKRAKALEHRQAQAIEEKSRLLKNREEAESLKLSPLAYHKAQLARLLDVAVFYEGRPACEEVTLEVRAGERIWLKGPNGAGKSTMLKVLLGQPLEYTGTLEKGSGLKISYVAQDTSFLRGSLRDFAAEAGVDESLMKAILRKLDFQRTQLAQDMAGFSQGQKKKVLLAKSLAEQAHLYLWDEPLNYIDVFSRMQIEELLLEYSPTMVFVEHDEAFGSKIATREVRLAPPCKGK